MQTLHLSIRTPFLPSIIKLTTVLLISVSLILGPGNAYSDTDDQYYEDALRSYGNDDYQTAIIHLKNALGQNEGHLPSRVLMAKTLIAMGNGSDAELHIDFAKAQGVDLNQLITLYGEAYLLQDKYKELLEVVTPGIRSKSIEGQIHFLRGQAQLKLRRLRESDISYIEALNYNPKHEKAWLGRAQIAMQNRDYDKATEFVDKALDRHQPSSNALIIKSTLSRLAGDFDEAFRFINSAIASDDGNVQARLTRALYFVEQGRFVEAEPDLDFILEEIPNEPKAKYLKSVVNAALGRLNDALEDTKEIISLFKAVPDEDKNNNPIYYYLSGLTNFKIGNYGDAEKSLTKYLRIDPNNRHAVEMLATIHLKNNDPLAAKPILTKANLAYPGTPNLLNLLGLMNSQLNDFESAYFYFDEVIRIAPDSPVGLVNKARTKLRAGEYQQSIDLFKQAQLAGLDPLETKLLLLDVYFKSNQTALALNITSELVRQFPENPDFWQKQGIAQGMNNQIDEARLSFEKALSVNENHIPSIIHLSRMDEVSGDRAKAISRIESKLKELKDNRTLLLEMGNIRSNNREYETALTWYQKAYAQDQNNFPTLRKIVNSYVQLNDYQKAIGLLRDFINKNGGKPEPYRLIGELYEATHDNEMAIKSYRLSTKFSPNQSIELLNLARMQQKAGLIKDAMSTYKKAIIWDNRFLPAYLSLADLAIKDRDQEYANILIAQIKELTPKSGTSENLSGELYFKLGKFDLAEKSFLEAKKLSGNPRPVFNLYRLYKTTNKLKKSEKLMTEWLSVHPDDLLGQIALADTHHNQNQLKKALDIYEKLIAEHGNMAVLLNNSANLLFDMGEKNKALERAQLAHKIAPANVELMDTLAWIYSRLGQHNEALALFREALLQQFDQPAIKYHLALTLDQIDRRKEAQKFLAEAMDSEKFFEERSEAETLLKSWQN
ncbi:XrtA/PEP-CTERM system TPR-repeat protein PrsT [Motiliproteus sp. MSK22-1]|uniref:XrtA/PEP-CTERM system TPR-repeat protein PrsT n=1 Tax=Motiliproteus sp. MSK22-1 TaxID=1897630 RepID=UPI001E43F2BA|nr:XrtA/PEP-CTERM system TPR-repeat protein PrsT [Motiliproteus sp. MSK22-1]